MARKSRLFIRAPNGKKELGARSCLADAQAELRAMVTIKLVHASRDNGVTMAWNEEDFFHRFTLGHGIVIAGPANYELRQPSRIRGLSDIRGIISMWRSGRVHFEHLNPAHLEKLCECERLRKAQIPRFDRGRYQLRGPFTVGMKAKGKIKSPFYVAEADL